MFLLQKNEDIMSQNAGTDLIGTKTVKKKNKCDWIDSLQIILKKYQYEHKHRIGNSIIKKPEIGKNLKDKQREIRQIKNEEKPNDYENNEVKELIDNWEGIKIKNRNNRKRYEGNQQTDTM